jgi:hypothetical protein
MWAFQEVQQRKRPERFTQTDLANQVNVRTRRTFSQATANGWLAGSVPKDLATMDALATALECDHMWLYFNRGEAPAGWAEHRRRFPPPKVAVRKLTTAVRKSRRASGG